MHSSDKSLQGELLIKEFSLKRIFICKSVYQPNANIPKKEVFS